MNTVIHGERALRCRNLDVEAGRVMSKLLLLSISSNSTQIVKACYCILLRQSSRLSGISFPIQAGVAKGGQMRPTRAYRDAASQQLACLVTHGRLLPGKLI